MINCKERVIRAIRHRDTGTTPYNVLFTHEEWEKMAAYYGDGAFADRIGNHVAYLDIRPPKERLKPGSFRDEFGVVWDRTRGEDIGMVAEYLVSADNVGTFAFPDPADPVRYENIDKQTLKYRDRFIVAKYAHWDIREGVDAVRHGEPDVRYGPASRYRRQIAGQAHRVFP